MLFADAQLAERIALAVLHAMMIGLELVVAAYILAGNTNTARRVR